MLVGMPANPKKDVPPRNYERLLPKQEAPVAPLVGGSAVLCAALFLLSIVALDSVSLFQAGLHFARNFKLFLDLASDHLIGPESRILPNNVV